MQVNSASSAALRAAIIDAYTNLTRDQLVLFLSLRRLPIDGSSIDLTHRLAKHDLETYSSSPLLVSFPLTPEVTPDHPPKLPHTQRHTQMPPLPVELVAEILDHVGDWELATAVGLVTALQRPRKWVDATPMDHAVLSGSLVRMSKANASPLTKVGANSILRLGYIHILEYLLANDRATFDEFYGGINSRLIPLRASCSGRTEVLSWWIAQEDLPKDYGDDAIDEACRHGQLETLKWWQDPSHPEPRYTEAALENASAKGHIHILSWWKQSGLPLKVGRVMDTASKSGQVQVLEWWLRSGIEVKYDNGILEHASRAGRVAVLEWWHNSGLQMMVCPTESFPTILDTDCLHS